MLHICRNIIFNEKPRYKIIEFIDKTNIIKVKADSKIDKDESISLLKKTKNSWQSIQRDSYLLHGRYSMSTETHSEIVEIHSEVETFLVAYR